MLKINDLPRFKFLDYSKAMCRNSVWSDVRIERKYDDFKYEGYDVISGRQVIVQIFENQNQMKEVKIASKQAPYVLPKVYRSYRLISLDGNEHSALLMEQIEGNIIKDKFKIDMTCAKVLSLDIQKWKQYNSKMEASNLIVSK